jgi:outer membrane protein assembly factor BamA
LLTGCSITHNVGEGEFLLDKNSVSIDRSNTGQKDLNFDPDEINGIIQQKPNKKLLWIFRPRVWVNSMTSKGKQTKFKKWLNRSLGSEPVIFDTYMVDRSINQIEQYLDNYGYFYSRITSEVTRKNKKASVKYCISLTRPYIIKNVYYKIQDSVLNDIVVQNQNNFLVKKHSIYNANLLDDDRYNITRHLRDNGYFYFSPEFIYYEVDSAFNNHELDIYLNIEQVQVAGDTNPELIIKENHNRYFINQISINPNFDPLLTDTSNMLVYRNPNPLKGINRYRFYYRDKLKIRPKAIRNSIFMEPLKLYSETSEKNTYKQLSSLSLFGYTSIEFWPLEENPIHSDTSKKYINCTINLTRRPVQSFSIETEGTTSGGQLGIAGNFVYQNLNIFRGGEVLTIKLTGGVEWQQGGRAHPDVFLFFNTFETGAEASLDFPKFLLPVSQDRIPKLLRPRTTIKTGVNYQNRPDYERYVTNLSFGYNWRANEFVSHSLIPAEINSVSIFPDSAFIKKIDDLNDPRLKNQYTDHFIMALKYSYIYNNQQRNKVKNFTFFRWDIETAGNFLGLINKISNTSTNENGEHTIFNIPYAQYIRSDVDFRKYFALDKDNTVVYRNYFGIGIPYGNSSGLPFEKGFYAGGASDMRGWNYRTLGPGSFKDTSGTYFERMGDIVLQANLEYRFPIYSFLKGAVFADFGNTWLLNSSSTFPGGKFEFSKFLGEIAIDGGVGARLDFSFFIFRVDAAIPLKNPAYPAGKRWQINSLMLKDVIWNFGIGYPF